MNEFFKVDSNRESSTANGSLNRESNAANGSLNRESFTANGSLNKESFTANGSLNKESFTANGSLNKESKELLLKISNSELLKNKILSLKTKEDIKQHCNEIIKLLKSVSEEFEFSDDFIVINTFDECNKKIREFDKINDHIKTLKSEINSKDIKNEFNSIENYLRIIKDDLWMIKLDLIVSKSKEKQNYDKLIYGGSITTLIVVLLTCISKSN